MDKFSCHGVVQRRLRRLCGSAKSWVNAVLHNGYRLPPLRVIFYFDETIEPIVGSLCAASLRGPL